MRRSPPHRVKNPPAPTPTPHVGPFVMSVEFQTPSADKPTYRVPYEEVATIAEAIAWISRPPFPPETLKKLKKGVLLTARVRAEWVMENGQRGEEIAAMGLVLRAGTKNFPAKIAVVTREGISVDGEMVGAKTLGLRTKKIRDVATWLRANASAPELLQACAAVSRPLLVLAACAVSRAALYLAPAGEERPRIAVETAEAWAYGRASLGHVKAAEDGAWAASTQAAWAAARAAATVADADWASAVGYGAAAMGLGDNALADCAQAVRRWVGLPAAVFAITTGSPGRAFP